MIKIDKDTKIEDLYGKEVTEKERLIIQDLFSGKFSIRLIIDKNTMHRIVDKPTYTVEKLHKIIDEYELNYKRSLIN